MQTFNFNPDKQTTEGNIVLYIKFLLRYWWIIGPLTFIGGAAAFYTSTILPPKYRAVCRLEIFENKAVQLGKDISGMRYNTFDNPLDRHIVTLEGQDLNNKIEADILNRFPELKKYHLKPLDLKIAPVKGAKKQMLDIEVVSFSKEAAVEYLTLLMKGYDKIRLDEYRREITSTRKTLETEEKNLNAQIETLQKNLSEFKTQNNFLLLQTKADFDKEYIADMLKDAYHAQMQIEILKNQLELFDSSDNKDQTLPVLIDSFFSVAKPAPNYIFNSNTSLQLDIKEWKKRQIERLRLETRVKNLLRKYKEAHPKIREVLDELHAISSEQETFEASMITTFRGRLLTLEKERDSYFSRAEKVQTSIGNQSTIQTKHDEMHQELSNLQELKNEIHARKLTYASIADDKFFKRLIRKPSLNKGIAWPNKTLFTLAGLMGTLFTTCGIILYICIGRARFYNFAILNRDNDISSMGVVPRFATGKSKKNPFFLNAMPKSDTLVEAYRGVRLNIDQQMEDKNILMVCSASPAEGKTTSSLHIALSYTWANRKVLLIDADFRRQNLGNNLSGNDSLGLLDYIKNPEKDIHEYIANDIAPGLDYLSAGQRDEMVTEILEAKSLGEVLEKLRDAYDIIILDSAPVNNVVDSIHLSKIVDGVVIVARVGKTLPEEVSVACNRLDEGKVLGYMLNDFKESDSDYLQTTASYYGYHSSYKYE